MSHWILWIVRGILCFLSFACLFEWLPSRPCFVNYFQIHPYSSLKPASFGSAEYMHFLNICLCLGYAKFFGFSCFTHYISFLGCFMESWNNLKFKWKLRQFQLGIFSLPHKCGFCYSKWDLYILSIVGTDHPKL